MAIVKLDSKMVIKRSTTAGETPTIGPSNDHTDGTWSATNIYPGELFYNLADNKLWIGNLTGVTEIDLQASGTTDYDFCSTGILTSAISGCSPVTIYDGSTFAASFSGNASVIGDVSNTASGDVSFVGGGAFNIVSGDASFIGGGFSNSASGDVSFVGGGLSNLTTTLRSAIIGGFNNTTSGIDSFIGGGNGNYINGPQSGVIAGSANIATGTRSTIIGGNSNSATTTNSCIIGGSQNIVSGVRTVILGGQNITGSSDDTVYVPNLNVAGNIEFLNIPIYDDDDDAGSDGLVIGKIYQTSGYGAAPLNVPGILMIKQ